MEKHIEECLSRNNPDTNEFNSQRGSDAGMTTTPSPIKKEFSSFSPVNLSSSAADANRSQYFSNEMSGKGVRESVQQEEGDAVRHEKDCEWSVVQGEGRVSAAQQEAGSSLSDAAQPPSLPSNTAQHPLSPSDIAQNPPPPRSSQPPSLPLQYPSPKTPQRQVKNDRRPLAERLRPSSFDSVVVRPPRCS